MKPRASRDRALWLIWGWLGGVLTAVAVGALAALLIMSGIAFNTSAASPHSRLLAWAVHKTMIHSVKRRAAKLPPLPPSTPAAILSGAAEYERHCITCHGGPGVPRAAWVSAMLPTPPFLLDTSAHWSPEELYELVHDGVKMTGMPAWGEIEPDGKITDIVAFLEAMPAITPHRFAKIRRRIGAPIPADGVQGRGLAGASGTP